MTPFHKCEECAEDFMFVPANFGRQAIFFKDTMNTAVQTILAGEQTTQEAMDEAKALIDAELARG